MVAVRLYGVISNFNPVNGGQDLAANIQDLTNRIEELVSEADRRLANQLRQTAEEAQLQQKRRRLFNELASEILQDEIALRLNHLAKYFPHAAVESIINGGTYGAVCRFRHTARFPASVELSLSCFHDDHVEHILCGYDLELLPVFIKFEKHDQVSSPLVPFDRQVICKWLDDKIVKFLETYLQLEFVDQYQRENQVTDPVSQARLNRAFATANSVYNGLTYYFTTDQNRELFEASPERYVAS